ncbi:MAG: F0F1 ATP synthase subunit gamma [Actinomycetota bacterium]
MAGGQERILRRRIKTVQATKKITRAMELIAASRIVKAQAKVNAAKPYSEKLTDVIANLSAAGAGADQPLLRVPEQVERTAYVVVTADRGLAGGYNNNILRLTERTIKAEQRDGRGYSLITIGKKARGYFSFRNFDIAHSFEGFSDAPTYADAKEVAETAVAQFIDGEVQKVNLVFTRFLSLGTQVPEIVPFVPLDVSAVGADEPAEEGGIAADYEYEPSPDGILGSLLPRYAEAKLYAALLEAAASEHAARQRAMKAATDNADDLITTLSRIMNRARQDAITTEIMEIVGGAEALRQAGGASGTDDMLDATQDLLLDQVTPQSIAPRIGG